MFNNALEYAVDLGRLPTNPLTRMNRFTPKVPEAWTFASSSTAPGP